MNSNMILSQWGPALLVCFTGILGLFYQNSRTSDTNARIADLKDSFNKRLDDFKAMVDNRFTAVDRRIDDLKLYIGAEFKRVDDRIDKLDRIVR